MPFDPSKWLEVLKTAITTAGIYKFALAVVCSLYWLAARNQWIPSADPWELRAAALGFFLFGSLWLATVISSVLSIFSPRYWSSLDQKS
jgi:cytochrome b561